MKVHLFITIIILIGCAKPREFAEPINVEELQNTNIVSTLEENIDSKKNQIYCPTLLFAWNEFKKELNGEIKINKNFTELIALNKSTNHENSLQPGEINKSIIIKGNLIKVRSEFNKSLPFEHEFQKDNYDLNFNSFHVRSFGLNGFDKNLGGQVKIIFYNDDHSFAIKLLPKDTQHEIILYKPEKNNISSIIAISNELNQNIKTHNHRRGNRKNNWEYTFEPDDILSIPVLNFNIEKNYKHLIGNNFQVNNQEYILDEVYQRVAFILDEKGAKIESEAEITSIAADAIKGDSPKPKRLIFDKPFLLIIKRVESENPYMVAWIVNEELFDEK